VAVGGRKASSFVKSRNRKLLRMSYWPGSPLQMWRVALKPREPTRRWTVTQRTRGLPVG
jgi:hypothetical protein